MIKCKVCNDRGWHSGEYEDKPCAACCDARLAAGFGWSRNREAWLPKAEYNAELQKQIAKMERDLEELRLRLLP